MAIAAALLSALPGNMQGAEKSSLIDNMVLVSSDNFIMGMKPADLKVILEDIEVDRQGKTIEEKHGGKERYHYNAIPQRLERTANFYIDKYEVTNTQYKGFCDATGHKIPEHWNNGKIEEGKENHPVVYVSWYDAKNYCEWKGKRLPTEEEWEHAARGNDGRLFPWGFSVKREIPKFANLEAGENSIRDTVEVGKYSKGRSPYQAMDMCGNVGEWTASIYLPYPDNKYPDEFYCTNTNEKRYIVRGGSYCSFSYESTVTFRYKYTPVSNYWDIGFRCAISGLVAIK